MALVPIRLHPGINVQATPTLNEGGWSESENIRFFQGLAQKIGGFVAFCHTLDGAGIPKALLPWSSLSAIAFLAIACGKRLNLFGSDVVADITPSTISSYIPISLTTTAGSQIIVVNDATNTPAVGEWFQIRDPISSGGIILLGAYGVTATGSGFYNIMSAVAAVTSGTGGVARTFTSQVGSPIVTVILPNHGLFTGDTALIPDLSVIGGIPLQGSYTTTVLDPNTYAITGLIPATSAVTVTENANGVPGAGDGPGTAQLTFFNPIAGATQQDLNIQTWTLANWGEFLLACPIGGPVFVWMPALGTGNPAMDIPTVPQSSLAIFVATQEQILFCLGTVNRATGLVDPMLVAWSDAGDYTDFIPSITNQAGSFRLSSGSRIIGGLALAGGCLIWTDLTLYSVQYLQPPLVWGFQPIGINCGLIGPHAFGVIGQNVFWMSQNQFYYLSGGAPVVIPCTVWDRVFKNLDRANAFLTTCETNAYFNEVSWEVPQLDGTTTRAKVQIDPGLWDYSILPSGNFLPRTAWTDQSIFGPPIAADATGQIWQHEVGNDAGTDPLLWMLKTGVIQIAEGDDLTFIREVIPDIKFSASGDPAPGVVELLIYLWGRPQDPPRVKGPASITSQTRSVPAARGRGWGIQFEFRGRDMGSSPRLGDMRYRGASDGRSL